MEDKTRAEFEAWAAQHGYFDCGHWDEYNQRYAGMELRAAYHGWQACNAVNQAEIKRLREALGFYACDNNYVVEHGYSAVTLDVGEQAQQALTESNQPLTTKENKND